MFTKSKCLSAQLFQCNQHQTSRIKQEQEQLGLQVKQSKTFNQHQNPYLLTFIKKRFVSKINALLKRYHVLPSIQIRKLSTQTPKKQKQTDALFSLKMQTVSLELASPLLVLSWQKLTLIFLMSENSIFFDSFLRFCASTPMCGSFAMISPVEIHYKKS